MSEGIKLVRVVVHKDDFDRLHSLILYLFNNPEETGDFKQIRKEYGRLRWNSGRKLPDDWIDIFIDRYDFIMLSRYGSYMSKVWDKDA